MISTPFHLHCFKRDRPINQSIRLDLVHQIKIGIEYTRITCILEKQIQITLGWAIQLHMVSCARATACQWIISNVIMH